MSANTGRQVDEKTVQAMQACIHSDGVVVKPLSDMSLRFETSVIMRASDDSRLVNEFVRSFLRKCTSQRLQAEQLELSLSA